MTIASWLFLYCGFIIVAAVAGGCVPLWFRPGHRNLQIYLSFASGVLIGAATFHMIGHARVLCGSEVLFGWSLTLGLLVPFMLDRFIAPHAHEFREAHLGAGHEHRPHEHAQASHADTARPAVPPQGYTGIVSWATVSGIAVHTFLNGLALAGAVHADAGSVAWPGLPILLAIALHKPADTLAVAMVLLNKGASRVRVLLVQLGCVLMVPVGCIAFELTQGASLLGDAAIGAVVALSAGMFLYVALADLLPEVQFQHQHRLELSLSLLAALTLMAAVTGLEDHTGHQHAPLATSEDHTGHQH